MASTHTSMGNFLEYFLLRPPDEGSLELQKKCEMNNLLPSYFCEFEAKPRRTDGAGGVKITKMEMLVGSVGGDVFF